MMSNAHTMDGGMEGRGWKRNKAPYRRPLPLLPLQAAAVERAGGGGGGQGREVVAGLVLHLRGGEKLGGL